MEHLNNFDEEKQKKYKKIRIIIQVAVIAILLGIAIFAIVKLLPIMYKFQNDEDYRLYMLDKIDDFGIYSSLIVIGLQIIQTILAVIPSGPIVMLSGMLFRNPWVAVLLCIIGQTIGGAIVYLLIKTLGVSFVALFMDPNKIKNSPLLENEERSKVLMSGYLLIPALPKDIVAFVAPFTKIGIKDFILISFFARIPMTIVTVFIGTSLFSGAYFLAIGLGILSFILAVLCFIFNKKITAWLEKNKKRK